MKPYLAILTTIFLFSTIEISVHLIKGAINPYFLATIRFFLAGLLMVLMSYKTFSKVTKTEWLWLLGLGIFGIGATFAPFHYVLDKTQPEEVALVFSLNPIFASIMAVVLLKESIKKNQIYALILGIVGVYIVKFGFKAYNPASLSTTLLLLWTAISFGFYTAASKKIVLSLGGLFTTGVGFLIGSFVLLLCSGGDFAISSPSKTVPVVLYLTFITTFIGYLLYFYGLKRVPVATGAALFYLKPLIATMLVILAIVIFPNDPRWHLPQWNYYVGMMVIFLSLTISIEPWRKK